MFRHQKSGLLAHAQRAAFRVGEKLQSHIQLCFTSAGEFIKLHSAAPAVCGVNGAMILSGAPSVKGEPSQGCLDWL
ncbi:MAG: hypothetical protein CUN49_01020 [Candidatus Thermofonsia Clade 1 bacterium]|uniref:Uncharacterized protein n=1 Tax=Candidatus Thermofonsia Clade 1 bacterium TaxID=2364210 RepID=A0A2M8PID9_9CHLR|nr:MAG: hypothetical protein CUN49_01020 [Candidatus Thermofonsia Clade 1 bacterium]